MQFQDPRKLMTMIIIIFKVLNFCWLIVDMVEWESSSLDTCVRKLFDEFFLQSLNLFSDELPEFFFVKKRTVFKAHPFFSFIHFLILKNSNFFHLIQSNKTNAQANTQTIYIHLSYLIFYRLNNISSSNFESYVELWSILLFIQQNEKRIQVCFHSFI